MVYVHGIDVIDGAKHPLTLRRLCFCLNMQFNGENEVGRWIEEDVVDGMLRTKCPIHVNCNSIKKWHSHLAHTR